MCLNNEIVENKTDINMLVENAVNMGFERELAKTVLRRYIF